MTEEKKASDSTQLALIKSAQLQNSLILIITGVIVITLALFLKSTGALWGLLMLFALQDVGFKADKANKDETWLYLLPLCVTLACAAVLFGIWKTRLNWGRSHRHKRSSFVEYCITVTVHSVLKKYIK